MDQAERLRELVKAKKANETIEEKEEVYTVPAKKTAKIMLLRQGKVELEKVILQ